MPLQLCRFRKIPLLFVISAECHYNFVKLKPCHRHHIFHPFRLLPSSPIPSVACPAPHPAPRPHPAVQRRRRGSTPKEQRRWSSASSRRQGPSRPRRRLAALPLPPMPWSLTRRLAAAALVLRQRSFFAHTKSSSVAAIAPPPPIHAGDPGHRRATTPTVSACRMRRGEQVPAVGIPRAQRHRVHLLGAVPGEGR